MFWSACNFMQWMIEMMVLLPPLAHLFLTLLSWPLRLVTSAVLDRWVGTAAAGFIFPTCVTPVPSSCCRHNSQGLQHISTTWILEIQGSSYRSRFKATCCNYYMLCHLFWQLFWMFTFQMDCQSFFDFDGDDIISINFWFEIRIVSPLVLTGFVQHF